MKPTSAVAIGASLGGLTALQTLLSDLAPLPHTALFIVQHRGFDPASRLAHLLQTHCQMPVVEPEDKQSVLAAHVYLAPPGYHLLADREEVSLSIDAPVLRARPSINVLFESVAEAFRQNSVGVVLTNSSIDGAAGARAIRRRGGCVIVQSPETAESDTAIRAVLESRESDVTLPLLEIGRHLTELCRAFALPTAPRELPENLR